MNETEFWKWVLYISLGSYFGLGVILTIGGWFDVWKMLRRLAGRTEGDESQPLQ